MVDEAGEMGSMYYWHWVKNLLSKPLTTGYPTEPDREVRRFTQSGSVARIETEAVRRSSIQRSCAIRQVDAGSCNGCESELSLLVSPNYDFTRYGFSYTPVPKHADLLVITGVITEPMVAVIKQAYAQMGTPKRVLALGDCAISGGWFKGAPGVLGSLDGVVAVSVSVEGCPPAPPDILRGLLTALDGEEPRAVGEGDRD